LTRAHTHAYTHTQHLYFSGESSYIIIKQVAGCDDDDDDERATTEAAPEVVGWQ